MPDARRLKVLLTHERFPPDYAGGGEHAVLHTARYLREHDVDVRVLTTGDPAIRSFDGIDTQRLPIHRYRLNLAFAAIAREARDVDVIQTFNYHACLASLTVGRWLRKPVVCGMLGMFQSAWRGMRGPLAPGFVAWERLIVSRRFDRLFFLSEYSRQQGEALGADPLRTAVVNIGIDCSLYGPAPEREQRVLFVGQFDVRKGVDDVVEAARRLPDVPFDMVGWGGEEERLRQIAPPNLRVSHLTGEDALRPLLARASIFLLPSRGEGFPLALLQAMASGCAVVCTLPFDFAGEHVPVGDMPALVRAVARLAAEPERAAALGARNMALAREYSWDNYARTLITMYREVLNERAGRIPVPVARPARSVK